MYWGRQFKSLEKCLTLRARASPIFSVARNAPPTCPSLLTLHTACTHALRHHKQVTASGREVLLVSQFTLYGRLKVGTQFTLYGRLTRLGLLASFAPFPPLPALLHM